MTRAVKIDTKLLKKLGACSDGIGFFNTKYPDGFVLTDDMDTSRELFEVILDNDGQDSYVIAEYTKWLLRVMFYKLNTLDTYFGNTPWGPSYNGRNDSGCREEYSVNEPEHLALIATMYVDKFGE